MKQLKISALICGGALALSLPFAPVLAAPATPNAPMNAPTTMPAMQNNVLAGTQWQLISPKYAGLENAPTLRFDEDRLSASVGLNQMGGNYVIDGSKLTFSPLFSTKMAGPPALMQAETRYAGALDKIRGFEISRDGKTLTLRGAQILTFERVNPMQNNPLAGTWMATVAGMPGVVTNKSAVLKFTDKTIRVSVGLNKINGQYTTAGSKINITGLASTKMAGPPALMQRENALINALSGATDYQISPDGQTLTLRGKETLTYSRLLLDAALTDPLAQTQWELMAPTYAGLDKKPTLKFDKDNLGASVGLNGMGAGYQVDGDKITLQQFISTMMAGPPALMQAEDAYKKALAGARNFSVSPDGKTLTLRGDTTLTFASTGAVPTGWVPTETKIINVAPQLGPEFDGDQTPKYLQLEDLSQGASWGRFTEPRILGFDPQPGNRYQLRVQVERDAQSGEKQLRLLEVFSQHYAATSPLGAGEKILEVAPTKVDCVGMMPMKCLQVREVGGDWRNFFAPIEGFDWVEGSRYRLQVKVSQIANPPADGSSLRYQLVRVLDKMPVTY